MSSEMLAEALQQPLVLDTDALAQFIRKVDGNNKLGAGALAELLVGYVVAHSDIAIQRILAAHGAPSAPSDQVKINALVEALTLYMAICGNTAHSVDRQSAQEAFSKGTAALGLAGTP